MSAVLISRADRDRSDWRVAAQRAGRQSVDMPADTHSADSPRGYRGSGATFHCAKATMYSRISAPNGTRIRRDSQGLKPAFLHICHMGMIKTGNKKKTEDKGARYQVREMRINTVGVHDDSFPDG